MNNLFKISLLAITSVIFLAFSQKKIAKTDEPIEVKSSLLWKIEGNGLKKPSYLFGTMHMIQKNYFYFPSGLEKIIKKSDLAVMEVSMDEMSDQAKTMEYLVLKEGTLMDFFNTLQQDSIYAWAKKKLNLDKALFDATFSKFKPFVIVQTAVQLNFTGKTESYEVKINELASKYKVNVVGLETIAEQIKFIDDMPKEKQALMVIEGITNEEKTLAVLDKMQVLYTRQHLDSLYLMTKEEGGTFAIEENTLLINRNKNWIKQIEKHIQSGQTFIAVGAAHLPAETGLIELLRKKGYIVTPVKI